jgi:hypothetical protein
MEEGRKGKREGGKREGNKGWWNTHKGRHIRGSVSSDTHIPQRGGGRGGGAAFVFVRVRVPAGVPFLAFWLAFAFSRSLSFVFVLAFRSWCSRPVLGVLADARSLSFTFVPGVPCLAFSLAFALLMASMCVRVGICRWRRRWCWGGIRVRFRRGRRSSFICFRWSGGWWAGRERGFTQLGPLLLVLTPRVSL